MVPVIPGGPETSPQSPASGSVPEQDTLLTDSEIPAGHARAPFCIFPDHLSDFLLSCDQGPKTEVCHPTQVLSYEAGCGGE